MAKTRMMNARVPVALETLARSGAPELAHVGLSTLLRAGLASLAGHSPADAVRIANESAPRGRPAGRPAGGRVMT